ncbi:MAG: hypothetical protein R3F11_08960 [Verrucomicrobiales bacterium]
MAAIKPINTTTTPDHETLRAAFVQGGELEAARAYLGGGKEALRRQRVRGVRGVGGVGGVGGAVALETYRAASRQANLFEEVVVAAVAAGASLRGVPGQGGRAGQERGGTDVGGYQRRAARSAALARPVRPGLAGADGRRGVPRRRAVRGGTSRSTRAGRRSRWTSGGAPRSPRSAYRLLERLPGRGFALPKGGMVERWAALPACCKPRLATGASGGTGTSARWRGSCAAPIHRRID